MVKAMDSLQQNLISVMKLVELSESLQLFPSSEISLIISYIIPVQFSIVHALLPDILH